MKIDERWIKFRAYYTHFWFHCYLIDSIMDDNQQHGWISSQKRMRVKYITCYRLWTSELSCHRINKAIRGHARKKLIITSGVVVSSFPQLIIVLELWAHLNTRFLIILVHCNDIHVHIQFKWEKYISFRTYIFRPDNV